MSRIGEALQRAGAPDVALGMELLGPGPRGDAAVPAAVPVPEMLPDADSAEPRIPVAAPPADQGRAAVPESPMAAVLGDARESAREKLVANPDLAPIAVEQYRRLAGILHHAQEGSGIRRVLVASALAEEGKTLTAINVALTLSQSYARRVLLIDADLRRPGVSRVFGLSHGAGLADALNAVRPCKLPLVQLSPTLSLLPAGRPTADPMAGLTSARMAAILEEASQTFDWVIIDSPPVGLMTDARLLVAMADAALLVVAAGATPFAAIQRATEAIGRERLLGVVLNRVEEKIASPDDYYYRYYGYAGRDRKPGLLARLLRRV